MEPIFHVEYTEKNQNDATKDISHKHVYYSNKVETFVKYATTWFPVKLTKLFIKQSNENTTCPVVTPTINISKDKDLLYLDVIYQHYTLKSTYKSIEWYKQFMTIYKQTRKHSIGQKRKMDNWDNEQDSFIEKKRKLTSESVASLLDETTLANETTDSTLANETTRLNENSVMCTPSKKLAKEMDSKLDFVPKRQVPVFDKVKEHCSICNRPVEPVNAELCLIKIYDKVDQWITDYYSNDE